MTSTTADNVKWYKDVRTRALILRFGIFVAVVLSIQAVIFTWFRHTVFFYEYLSLSEQYYIPFLAGLSRQNLISAALFILFVFVIYNRAYLVTLPTGNTAKTTWLFGIGSLLALVLHYALKAYLKASPNIGADAFFAILKLLLTLLFVILLFLACVGWRFVRELLSKRSRMVLAFVGIGILYFGALLLFQNIWFGLSMLVSYSIFYLLGIFYDTAIMQVTFGEAPILGAEDFVVGISKVCSGIDSLLLFISLFIFIAALSWNSIDKRKYALVFSLGIVCTIIYNILRVWLIIIVGIEYNPEFAIDTFHTNAGWIMFLIFFAIFWHFGSNWIYKKQ